MLVKREIPWLLVASLVVVIAVQVYFPSGPTPIKGIVGNKTVIGFNGTEELVIVEFTIYGVNSTIDNWEELFKNGTSIISESETLLMESYEEIQYRMVVGYKEDVNDYIVSREDFNMVEPYEIIMYIPDGDQLTIEEVVRSTD